MDINPIEWDRLNREEGQHWSKFSNGYSGKFGDEKVSMLWVDGKRVAYFKKISKGVAEDT